MTKSASSKKKAVFLTLNRVLDARELLAVEDCCLTHLDDNDFDGLYITQGCWFNIQDDIAMIDYQTGLPKRLQGAAKHCSSVNPFFACWQNCGC